VVVSFIVWLDVKRDNLTCRNTNALSQQVRQNRYRFLASRPGRTMGSYSSTAARLRILSRLKIPDFDLLFLFGGCFHMALWFPTLRKQNVDDNAESIRG
jgi:hypothetical protein